MQFRATIQGATHDGRLLLQVLDVELALAWLERVAARGVVVEVRVRVPAAVPGQERG